MRAPPPVPAFGLLAFHPGFTIRRVSDEYRPSIRHALYNWRHYKGPLHKKVALTAKNEWRKIRRFKDCCDNIDEPGC